MRKLVTIRVIDQINPIEGADLIEMVKIEGWQCVVKRGEFSVGDRCVYFEIDSFLPLRPQYDHIKERCYRKMGDKEGLRIKTIRLRGQISQGLALPLSKFPEIIEEWDRICNSPDLKSASTTIRDIDFSELLQVEKYEPPVPTQLAGNVSSNFPSFIPKTDQERCQNLVDSIFIHNKDSKYEVTLKLDGTSFTSYFYDGRTGVCGRNWELKIDENETNSLVRMFVDSGLQEVLSKFGRNIAIQGELMGPGIQKNREGFDSHKLFVFDIYDIDSAKYLTPSERKVVLQKLYDYGLNFSMVDHVPVICHSADLFDTLGISNLSSLLSFADGKSINHSVREGLVFKRLDGQFSFKAISNSFLLKEE